MSRVRQGGGFGFVILLVVLAVILFLVSKSSSKLVPAALPVASQAEAVDRDQASPEPPSPAVNSGAGQAPIQSRLSDAQAKTSAHSAQVQDALKGQ